MINVAINVEGDDSIFFVKIGLLEAQAIDMAITELKEVVDDSLDKNQLRLLAIALKEAQDKQMSIITSTDQPIDYEI